MTVAELIKKLQEMPADLPVYLADWNTGYAPDTLVTDGDGPCVRAACEMCRHPLPERVVIGVG